MLISEGMDLSKIIKSMHNAYMWTFDPTGKSRLEVEILYSGFNSDKTVFSGRIFLSCGSKFLDRHMIFLNGRTRYTIYDKDGV